MHTAQIEVTFDIRLDCLRLVLKAAGVGPTRTVIGSMAGMRKHSREPINPADLLPNLACKEPGLSWLDED